MSEGKEFWRMVAKGLATAGQQGRLSPSLDQEFYTVAEAVRELSDKGVEIHEETLRRWIRAGKVEISQPSSRKTLIHKNELVRLLTRPRA